MKNVFICLVVLLTSLNLRAQCTAEYKVNPVFLCNSSTITSVDWTIRCGYNMKAIVEYKGSNGRWLYQSTRDANSNGEITYRGTGLRLNQYHNYRFYIYSANTRVSRYDLKDSDYSYQQIYVNKICN